GAPREADVVAAIVHLPRTRRAGAVADRAFRVAGLQAERVALEAEDVVQREAAGHREAQLVGRVAVERRVGGAVVAAARVVPRGRPLRIAPGLGDAGRGHDVGMLLALVGVRLHARGPLAGNREVVGEVAAAARRLAVVLERDRGRNAVAELRRVGETVDA